jgi:uncharacterized protein (TIGR03083 family)
MPQADAHAITILIGQSRLAAVALAVAAPEPDSLPRADPGGKLDPDADAQMKFDPRAENPFPAYDAEIRRLRRYLHGLDAAGWRASSHCRGWSVKDVVAHLSTDEVYNQAGLDHSLDQLDYSGGLNASNERGVRSRRPLSSRVVLEEWETRQKNVRRRWGRLGLRAKIDTSVGAYPLRLQAWHLAQEYAIHADDIEVPVPARVRRQRARWRIQFGIWAAREEGEPEDARLENGTVRLRVGGTVHNLDPETFVAYLTNRPQQLTDPTARALVKRLGRSG